MHFCDVTLSAKKPLSEVYPKTLLTIGDHVRKRRLDLKLFQRDVAKLLGVTTSTITNWEKNRGGPALRLIPKIIKFLEYDPSSDGSQLLGEKIKSYRRMQGLSIKKLARVLGIDPTTLARWESGESEPSGNLRKRFSRFFDALP
ncbi:MAG: helix-turn-helix transcriptional regulator [Bacteroidetes bacterium]|nr:helix-turn-helix transcriptional regulator [Bacteroidota bacterium]